MSSRALLKLTTISPTARATGTGTKGKQRKEKNIGKQ